MDIFSTQPFGSSITQLRHSMTVADEARQCPHYEAVARGDFYPTIFAHGPFSPSDQSRVLQSDYVLVAALCWPACTREALWCCAAISLVFVERDDLIDAGSGSPVQKMIKACIADAEQGFTTAHERLFGKLMKIIWDRLRQLVPAGQLDRLTTATLEYLQGCLETVERRAETPALADLDLYFQQRRRNIGQAVSQILTEISLGIDLSQKSANPLLRAANTCDTDRIILLQDLQSLHKEIADGEAAENIVTVMARSRNITTAQATRLAKEHFRALMEQHAEISAKLIQETDDEEISDYLRAADEYVAGLAAWNSRSPRYAGSR